MSPVILNGIFLTFINEPQAIEATNLSHIHLLGSLILALDPYPFVFINTVEGPFHSPLLFVSFFFLATSQNPSSVVAVDLRKCINQGRRINLIEPEQCGAPPLFRSTGEFLSFSTSDLH